MLAYYDTTVENIDIATELGKPRPVIAQVKYDENFGIRKLSDGVSFRKGDGTITDTLSDAVKPYEAILTTTINTARVIPTPKSYTEKDSAVLQLLESSLQNNIFSSRWKADGISEPTESCKESSLALSMLIFEQHSILPVRIAPSIEEGIMITYQKESIKLLIELYNTGEIAGLLRDETGILKADDFDAHNDALYLISEYKKLLA